MSKYSEEFKLKIIKYYLNHDYGYMKVAKYFKINHEQLRKWVKKYQEHGLEGLSRNKIVYDGNLEKLRDTCLNVRDLTILELLISTGMRVGEITRLNISDTNFQERSCIVLGKGNSEREVYFSAKKQNVYKEGISGIENLIRNLGKEANINKVHPHKFRRTMATMAIDKGMPIEQVQKVLGHIKIDTTMEYAMVSQNNVKNLHRKYTTRTILDIKTKIVKG